MTSRPKARRRGALVFLAFTLPLLLSGCFKFTMDLEVSSDDKISGTAVVALSKDLAGFAEETGGDDATDVFAETEGVTASEFDDGDFVGQQYEFAGIPIDELDFQDDSGGLTITRDGDFLNVEGDLNFEDDSADSGGDDFGLGQAFFDSADLRVSIKFPGDIVETNGEVNEKTNTITWSPKYGEANEISARVYAPQGMPLWVWVVVASAVVAVGLILTLGLFVLKKRRRGANGGDDKSDGNGETNTGPVAMGSDALDVPEVEGVRFTYSVRVKTDLRSLLRRKSAEVMEVTLGRDLLQCSFKSQKSGNNVSSETFKVSEISDAVFLSDLTNGMVVRLTVGGGIVDIPARAGDGKTLVKLLKKPVKRAESAPIARNSQPGAAESDDAINQIERLHELVDKGALSEKEFQEKKQEILKRL